MGRLFLYRKEVRRGMLYASHANGQGLLEYALILVLVVLIVIVILAIFGPAVGGMFSNVIANI